MTIEQKIEEIKKTHNGSFKTLCTIYFKKERFLKSKQMWGSVVLTIILSLVFFCFKNSTEILEILDKIVVKILAILPSILGFTLTGYALLLSFGSSEFMEKITEQEDEGYSFYQHFSSIFGWSIIIQATTLFIAFVISIISDYNLDCQYGKIINCSTFIIILFFSLYSLLLVSRLVLNVFTFGQVIQFHYTEKKLINEIDKENLQQASDSKKLK